MLRPLTKKQVRTFLGVVGFLQILIFEETATPLVASTQADAEEPLKWTSDLKKAFDDSTFTQDAKLQ